MNREFVYTVLVIEAEGLPGPFDCKVRIFGVEVGGFLCVLFPD